MHTKQQIVALRVALKRVAPDSDKRDAIRFYYNMSAACCTGTAARLDVAHDIEFARLTGRDLDISAIY